MSHCPPSPTLSRSATSTACNGKDIVVGLWSPGTVGVMLNHGDGTFAAMEQYSAGPECATCSRT